MRALHFAVGEFHHGQRFFDIAGVLETGDDVLRPVGGGEIGTAFGVVAGDGHFVACQRVHQFGHAGGSVFHVFALRVTLHQLGKRLIGFAVGLRVAVGPVLRGQFVEEGGVFVKQNQPFEVEGVVHVRVLRVQLLEAFHRRQGFFAFFVLIIGIGRIELRLLRVAALREARFQKFVQLDSAGIIAAVQLVLRFGVEFFHRPILSDLRVFVAGAFAGASGKGRAQCRY